MTIKIETDPEVIKFIKEYEKLKERFPIEEFELIAEERKYLYMLNEMIYKDKLFKDFIIYSIRCYSSLVEFWVTKQNNPDKLNEVVVGIINEIIEIINKVNSINGDDICAH